MGSKAKIDISSIKPPMANDNVLSGFAASSLVLPESTEDSGWSVLLSCPSGLGIDIHLITELKEN